MRWVRERSGMLSILMAGWVTLALGRGCFEDELLVEALPIASSCRSNEVLRRQIESSNSPAWLIYSIGSSGRPCRESLLLEYADEGQPLPEQYAAQLQLMRHYPSSWPYQARKEYTRLVGEDRYANATASLPSFHSRWWKSISRPWGEGAWNKHTRYFEPVASSAEWEAFLDAYPAFMSADDAAWHLARAYHLEGRPRRVVETLETGMFIGDRDTTDLIWAGLRHYLVERASEVELERWMHEPDWAPSTAYAIRYARGLRHLWNLEFEAAAETWDELEPVEAEPESADWVWSRSFGSALQRPEERIESCRRLIPFERQWRRHFDRPGEGRAFFELAQAILAEEAELRRDHRSHRGFFEPWLLVDQDISHPVGDLLGPSLSSYVELDLADDVAAEMSLLAAHLCPTAARFRAVAETYPDHPLSAQALFFAALVSEGHQAEMELVMARYPDSLWAEHALYWRDHFGAVSSILRAYAPLPLQTEPSLSVSELRAVYPGW